ncbi:hypothetical protein B484DRAFT_341868, partial [Ochromonadaceae sp. CCMP2298]
MRPVCLSLTCSYFAFLSCPASTPADLMPMFDPRKPLEFKPPSRNPSMPSYTGVGAFLTSFETTPPPAASVYQPPAEQKLAAKERLLQLHGEKCELLAADWDPHNNPKATENAYLTLFVGRLSYETSDKKLRREFEQYGAVKSVRVVEDAQGRPKGYAFVEFTTEEHMMSAYKKSDGKKIEGRRVVVDVERGRTVRNWRPARLGGGKGGRK